MKVLQLLLHLRCVIDQPNRLHETPLHAAVMKGSKPTLLWLLENGNSSFLNFLGANINAAGALRTQQAQKGLFDVQPIHTAVMVGNLEFLRILLEWGAYPSANCDALGGSVIAIVERQWMGPPGEKEEALALLRQPRRERPSLTLSNERPSLPSGQSERVSLPPAVNSSGPEKPKNISSGREEGGQLYSRLPSFKKLHLLQSTAAAAAAATAPTQAVPAADKRQTDPFYGLNETDIQLEDVRGQWRVVSGTIDKLIERFTHPAFFDGDFVEEFCYCFASFLDLPTLLSHLSQRWALHDVKIRKATAKGLIVLISKQTSGFFSPEVVAQLNDFVQGVIAPDDASSAAQISSRIAEQQHRVLPTPQGDVLRPKGDSIYDWPLQEVARQLCLLDSEIFLSLAPSIELADFNWKKGRGEHVQALLRRGNMLTDWVATEVVTKEKPRDREKVLGFLLSLCHECWSLNNFSSAMAIWKGLNVFSVRRLTKTWAKLKADKKLSPIFSSVRNNLSADGGYSYYRARLSMVTPPMVPVLSVVCEDLTMLNETVPSTLMGRPDYINFERCRFMARFVRTATEQMSTGYKFPVEERIRTFLTDLPVRTEEDRADLSRLLEPPEGSEMGKGELRLQVETRLRDGYYDTHRPALRERELIFEMMTENNEELRKATGTAVAQFIRWALNNDDRTGLQEVMTNNVLRPFLAFMLDNHCEIHREIDWKTVTDLVPLGSGASGEVFRATWNGRVVAVKTIRAQVMAPFEIEDFLREITFMTLFDHPNLIYCYGAKLDIEAMAVENPFIVMPFLPESLADRLARCRKKSDDLKEGARLNLGVGIASGMAYLHAAGILHRDLKSLNVMLENDNTAKLIDFGLARITSSATMTKAVGTLSWMAPEVILGEPYSETADVYSFSIVLWELATSGEPYEDVETANKGMKQVELGNMITAKGLRPTLPAKPSTFQKKLLKLCKKYWDRDPSSRPLFPTIVLETQLKALQGRAGQVSLRRADK